MRLFIMLAILLFSGLAQLIPRTMQENQQQRILAATVMISLKTPNWQVKASTVGETLPIPPDEYRTTARADGDVVADGLGTLVARNGETLLVTHNHWSHFDEAIGTVTFRTADGSLIAEMDLRAFKKHLRYQDAGTMVLAAPDVLSSAVAGRAKSLPAIDLFVNETVLLTQRAGNRVMVIEANVVAQGRKLGVPVARLRSADGQVVVGGDSGGGVWVNDQLAATMWAAVIMESPSTGQQEATPLSVVAIWELRPGVR